MRARANLYFLKGSNPTNYSKPPYLLPYAHKNLVRPTDIVISYQNPLR